MVVSGWQDGRFVWGCGGLPGLPVAGCQRAGSLLTTCRDSGWVFIIYVLRIQDWYFSLFNLVGIILDLGLEVKEKVWQDDRPKTKDARVERGPGHQPIRAWGSGEQEIRAN
jgi:hypothetical protein